MSGHYQTFPFQEGTEIFDSDTFSVFEAKRTSYFKDGLWDTHRGKILSNYHNPRKALVRSFRGTKKESRLECPAEVKKLCLVKEILEQCPHLHDVIKVPRTFYAEIDEVSVGCNLMSSDDSLKEGMCVVVHDIPEGKHAVFFFPERTTDDERDIRSLPHFLELAQASFKTSGGRRVISEMKGVKVNMSEALVYFLTSVTVHSVEKEFGVRDEGLKGVRSFQSLAKLEEVYLQNVEEGSRHEEPEHPEPSAPPAEDLEGTPNAAFSEDTSAKGSFDNPVNLLVPAATGIVHSTDGCMHEGVDLGGYPKPANSDMSSCHESCSPLSREHIMHGQHLADSGEAPPKGQAGAQSMSVPGGGSAKNQHASHVDVSTYVPVGPGTPQVSVPQNTVFNPNLSQANVPVNPLAHAATGTAVYSTGGCVHEGVSRAPIPKPKHVNANANNAETQTDLPQRLPLPSCPPLEQPSASRTPETALTRETQHSASYVPNTASSTEEQASTSQGQHAAASKDELPSASYKPHTASSSEEQPSASQGQHAAPARPETLHITCSTCDVTMEQGLVETPPPDYESCVQSQASNDRVPLSPPPVYTEKEEKVADAAGPKTDHTGPRT